MNNLNLSAMAIEILQINENFFQYLEDPYKQRVRDFTLETFEQCWGNTSGAFEGAGGCAMTNQRTYVFIPISGNIDYYLVFFGGRFGYKAYPTDEFKKDLQRKWLVGSRHGAKKYAKEESEYDHN